MDQAMRKRFTEVRPVLQKAKALEQELRNAVTDKRPSLIYRKHQ